MMRTFRLPRHAWAQIALRTVRHLAFAVLTSVAVSYLILETFSQGLSIAGLIAAIAAPIALAGPIVFYMSIKHCQLEMAYERLEVAASRDSLTQCLNHGAFVAAVSALIETPASTGGALLVIDADHFKSINDRFGHACGDTALKMIAATIRGTAQEGDIVGRLGGEEFGVYLPGRDQIEATRHAHDLCRRVRAIALDVGEAGCTLSVSIGGAACTGATAFGSLFRKADAHLYNIKNAGRDNVEIGLLEARIPYAPPSPTLVYRGRKVAAS